MERIYEKEIHDRTDMQMECSEDAIKIEWIHGENNGCLKNSWRTEIALESYFEERAQEIWERNLRKTALMNMCNPIFLETILKVLRE